MLIQADYLPDGQLWDSSAFLPEDGLLGQLLYAMVGYEASPAPVQVAIYLLSLSLMLLALFLRYRAGASVNMEGK